MAELILQATMFGPARLNNRYARAFLTGAEGEMVVAYAGAAEAIMDAYKEDIAKRFALTHGQSGETEQSMEVFSSPGVDTFQVGVRIGGHVGFVVNPIISHDEPRSEGGPNILGDFTPTGAASGRATNMFSPFGPRDTVTWFQGGSESFSPDTSWYTGDQDFLVAETYLELQKISKFVQLLFGYGAQSAWGHYTIADIQVGYYRAAAAEAPL